MLLRPIKSMKRLPGKPRPLLLKVRIQVLVEVVDKTQVDTDQKIIVKRIGCAQDPVLRDDVAAIGHDVGGKDHPG